jgi:hypothetical protein
MFRGLVAERRLSFGRRVAGAVAIGAMISWSGIAPVGAQDLPITGAAGTVTTCIIGGVDTSVCVDAAVASVNPATVAGPGLPQQVSGDMTIDKSGGNEVEHD